MNTFLSFYNIKKIYYTLVQFQPQSQNSVLYHREETRGTDHCSVEAPLESIAKWTLSLRRNRCPLRRGSIFQFSNLILPDWPGNNMKRSFIIVCADFIIQNKWVLIIFGGKKQGSQTRRGKKQSIVILIMKNHMLFFVSFVNEIIPIL